MRWFEKKGKWTRAAVTGTLCGLLNGLFGAGGGIAAVPLLRAGGLEQKKAHATSAGRHFAAGRDQRRQLSVERGGFLFGSLALSARRFPRRVCRSALMKKLSSNLLRRGFGALLIVAGIRLLLR